MMLVSGYPYLTAVVVVSISIELKEKSKGFSKQSMCQKASDKFLLTVPVQCCYLNYKLIMTCIFFLTRIIVNTHFTNYYY